MPLTQEQSIQALNDSLARSWGVWREGLKLEFADKFGLMSMDSGAGQKVGVQVNSFNFEINPAPGFGPTQSDGKLDLAIPLAGTWRFDLDVTFTGKIGGGSPLPLNAIDSTISLSTFRAVAHIDINQSDPEHPVTGPGFELSADLELVMAGVLDFKIDAWVKQTDPTNGTVALKGSFTGKTGKLITGLDILFTIVATLEMTPSPGLSVDLTLNIPAIPPVHLHHTFPLPDAVKKLEDLLTGISSGDLPIAWPPAGTPQPAIAKAPAADFNAEADAIERAIWTHAPISQIPPNKTPAADSSLSVMNRSWIITLPDQTTRVLDHFSGVRDSAIWTGHLLAAEAFRFAALDGLTEQADAETQARLVLNAIRKLFQVPEKITGQAGLMCRAALPGEFSIQAWPPFQNPGADPGTFPNRFNYYSNVAELPDAAGADHPWFGFGRGMDSPSRDQIIGVTLGLAFAHKFIPSLRPDAVALLRDMADYLLVNEWAYPTPAGQIGDPGDIDWNVHTSFMFELHIQLAVLKAAAVALGTTATPSQPALTFQQAYDDFAAYAAQWTWLIVWGDTINPDSEYFKFNLNSAAMLILLGLDCADPNRDDYIRAMKIMRRATGHHRNAYFDLAWAFTQCDPTKQQNALRADSLYQGVQPGPSVSDEIVQLLGEWLARRHNVIGPNGLPTQATTPQMQAHLLNLVSAGETGKQEGGSNVLSTFALPVQDRPGKDADFLWQRSPFLTGLADTPTGQPIDTGDAETASTESPGVDYLLAYWMARYLKVVP